MDRAFLNASPCEKGDLLDSSAQTPELKIHP